MPIQVISSRSTPRSIAIMKLDHRGDFILAAPALRRAFLAWPNAVIDLYCGSWNKASADSEFKFRDIISFDYFIEESSFSNHLSRPSEWRRAMKDTIGSRNYDLVIDLRVDQDTRHLLNAFNCRMKAGFGNPDLISYLDIALDLINPTLLNVPKSTFLPVTFFNLMSGARRLRNSILIRGSSAAFNSMHPAIESNQFQIPYGLTIYKFTIKFITEVGFLSYEFVDISTAQIIAVGCLDDEASKEGIQIRSSESISSAVLRIYTTTSYPLPLAILYGMSIVKEGRFTGPHQTEMMEMLITLCQSRLSGPDQLAL